MAPSLVREHPALRGPPARAGVGADCRAARRRGDVSPRLDHERNAHGLRPLSHPALRSDRPLHGVARGLPAGPCGVGQDRRAARSTECDRGAARCSRVAARRKAHSARCDVRLPQFTSGCARRLAGARAGRARCARRSDRRRKVDARETADASIRPSPG